MSQYPHTHERIIRCPVHGDLEFPAYVYPIVDTPAFQRLRELKQLSICHMVFPGATHSRFEHSLGVAFLCFKLITRLRAQMDAEKVDPTVEYYITNDDIKRVTIAGLCHDLGHGPFSHTFETDILPNILPKGEAPNHEQQSINILAMLNDDENIGLTPEDLDVIGRMIQGEPDDQEKKRFLFQIVSNPDYSLDMDKIDYIQRDSYYTGAKVACDFGRLIKRCRVMKVTEGESSSWWLCFSDKLAYTMETVFRARYELFRTVYFHPVYKAIEYMLADAIVAAAHIINLTPDILTKERLPQYCNLTDTITREVLKYKNTENDPQIAKAQQVLNNLYHRKLYKLVGNKTFAGELKDQAETQEHNTQKVNVDNFWSEGCGFDRDDIRVADIKANYNKNDQDPVAYAKFYHKTSDGGYELVNVEGAQISLLRPLLFEERVVQVFMTVEDEKKQAAVKAVFDEWAEGVPQLDTSALTEQLSQSSPDKLPRSLTQDGSPNKKQKR
eukprot:TRINITY_DN113550_c0_g1_i1.p1 TRINITY_DN113550_c0_g1~~TRINITY_DN113550_c0_g1_i1.p1  ORF type:complete len:498 (+),score=14.04 TRINITY_DN113550_c0_g1_i1:64-1557(+)